VVIKLKSSKETVDFLLKNGAKKIVLISHFGRPSGEKEKFFDNYLPEESLYIFADILKKIYKRKV
jgi:3-phosphoglycerate kinase